MKKVGVEAEKRDTDAIIFYRKSKNSNWTKASDLYTHTFSSSFFQNDADLYIIATHGEAYKESCSKFKRRKL